MCIRDRGIEGLSITVNGGDIKITASDDGVNSAGGTDTGRPEGRPGQNDFRAAENSSCNVIITGGALEIDASGDGLDSNGSFITVSYTHLYDTDVEINVVWVYISSLRKKLATLRSPVQIKAVSGAGYCLEERHD